MNDLFEPNGTPHILKIRHSFILLLNQQLYYHTEMGIKEVVCIYCKQCYWTGRFQILFLPTYCVFSRIIVLELDTICEVFTLNRFFQNHHFSRGKAVLRGSSPLLPSFSSLPFQTCHWDRWQNLHQEGHFTWVWIIVFSRIATCSYITWVYLWWW